MCYASNFPEYQVGQLDSGQTRCITRFIYQHIMHYELIYCTIGLVGRAQTPESPSCEML
jgi:hypothetical protein